MTENIELAGSKYELDQHGYLKDMKQWDAEIMAWFAEQDSIVINDDHLKVINYLRDFFTGHNRHPGIRVFTAALPAIFGPEPGTVKYLHELFPGSFNQAYKIAGLPVLHSCC